MSYNTNPVTDRLFVTSDVQSYTVVNLVGETIQTGNYTTNGIDVSSLEKGAYVVQLTTSNGLAYSKFVK